MDDAHYLALGKAVHAFQRLEWLTIWISTLVSDDGDIDKFDTLSFGQLVERLNTRLPELPASHPNHPVREAVEQWVTSLGPINLLRQDVFHAYPVDSGSVWRLRKDGQFIPIDSDQLGAARHGFNNATEEGVKLFNLLWPRSLEQPGFFPAS